MVRILKSGLRIVAWVSLIALGLFLGCVSRRGLEPGPVRYNIYVGATFGWFSYGPGPSKLYIYDADSLTLYDSIPLESMAFDMAISADGKSLYVQMDGPWPSYEGPLSLINARTKEVEWSRSGMGPCVSLHGNGRLLLNGPDVLDPRDGSLMWHLSDSLRPGRGPASGVRIAAIVEGGASGYWDDSVITILNVSERQTSGRYVPRLSFGAVLSVYYARLHPDENRVLAIGVRDRLEHSWFVVGNTNTGETLLEYPLIYPFGEVAISADGSIAVVTDPGRPLVGDSHPTLDVFDLNAMTHIKSFEGMPLYWPSQVRFLPDDRTIITAPTADGLSSGPLQLIDLRTLEVVKTIWLSPDEPFQGALGVAPRP